MKGHQNLRLLIWCIGFEYWTIYEAGTLVGSMWVIFSEDIHQE